MEPRKLVCGLCGSKTYRLSTNEDGVKICDSCSSMKQEAELDVTKPNVVIWVGQVAKQGVNRLFIIPKTQRPFLKLKTKYSIVVRELG